MRILKRILLGFLAVIVLLWAALMIYAYWPTGESLPAAQLARPGDQFITVNGVSLRYHTYGVPGPDKPNLVLIHGFGNNLQSWREVAPRLAECCYVVAFDLPGYGLSGKPVAFDYHNGPQARMTIDFARALGLAKPIYVGHSLGGAIALHAAVKDPDSGGLVLANPGIISTGVASIAKVTFPPMPRLAAKQFGTRATRERALRRSFANPDIVTPSVMDDVMLAARSEGYYEGMSTLMTQYSEGEELPLLPKVSVPTLIVWGDKDRNKPLSEADELQSLIKGAQLVRFPEAGHYVHEEAPQGVVQAIRDWLARDVSPPKA